MRSTRFLGGAALAAVLLAGVAGPASAHVSTDPSSAPQGGEITLGFRVPNEETGVNVVKVDVVFPTDHPLLGVAVEPLPGWTPAVTEVKLNPPAQTDDGPVAQAVSEIVWAAAAGGGTPPAQFQEFRMLVQRLPTDTNQAVFRAVQTYSDGTVVRWIDPIVSGHTNPDHPTPILTLTPAGAAGATTGPTTTTGAAPSPPVTVDLTKVAKKTTADLAVILGAGGIVLGGSALMLAAVALMRRRDPTAEALSDEGERPASR